jgi:multiple sugar transport system ATP-binding protein
MALELQGLSKSYRGKAVVGDVSLSADSGDIIAVFGPSGAGKTVLLRLIAGIEVADAGSIRIDGTDMTEASPDARGIGMAFQNYALFPHMTAYDNVASALTPRKLSPDVIKTRVDAIVRLLKIDHVMSHRPRELSNGQKQRTALARALVGAPKVLLLDDPLRNVDAKLRYEMRLELPNLLRKFGSTVLYVTQDYKEAMAIGSRIAVLIGGRIAQVAAPSEIYDNPASIGVARLFGDPGINLFDVSPSATGEIAIDNVMLPLGAGFAKAAGKDCVFGLRPEAVTVATEPNGACFAVDVLAETPLNEKSVLLMRTGDGREMLAALPAAAAGSVPYGRAYVSFVPSTALLFDRASTQRIAREAGVP